MKVICKLANLYGVQDPASLERLKKYINYPDGDFGLVLDKEYVVYGVTFWDGVPVVYIYVEESDDYPKPVFMDFLEVSDSRLSKFWTLAFTASSRTALPLLLAVKEWAEDVSFYEALVDGDENSLAVFRSYKSLMDNEFRS